jgi:diaminopimelate epimerase
VSYPFLKGHGTENDFVLLPDHDGSLHGELSAARVRALCDRRAGIGGDGVLRVIRTSALTAVEEGAPPSVVEEGAPPPSVVEEGAPPPSVVEEGAPPSVVEEGALRLSRDPAPDWFMDYRNADGSVAEMCGNGIRLFARHLYDEGLVPADEPIRIATRSGVKVLTRDGDVFTADLGPATIHGETKVSVGDRSWPATQVVVGNPHAVVMVDDLAEAGSLAEEPAYDEELFPDGVNVEFVVRRGPDHIAMRVHERGSGETRSCGTGACAAALASAGDGPGRWRVDVPGGTLVVSRRADGRVSLTGPAVVVARGETDL